MATRALLAAGLALALAGCGGSGAATSFTARATAICRATDAKLGALAAVTSQSGAASAIAVAAMKRLHLSVCARNL